MNNSTFTRRKLLRLSAAAAGAAFAGLRPWDAAPALAAPSHLRRSSYVGRIGGRFAAGSVDLRLVSVTDVLGAGADRALRDSDDAFALVFSGPLEPALEAGSHTLRTSGLGSFELFLSPIERPASERLYEAVIDRSIGVSSAR